MPAWLAAHKRDELLSVRGHQGLFLMLGDSPIATLCHYPPLHCSFFPSFACCGNQKFHVGASDEMLNTIKTVSMHEERLKSKHQELVNLKIYLLFLANYLLTLQSPIGRFQKFDQKERTRKLLMLPDWKTFQFLLYLRVTYLSRNVHDLKWN